MTMIVNNNFKWPTWEIKHTPRVNYLKRAHQQHARIRVRSIQLQTRSLQAKNFWRSKIRIITLTTAVSKTGQITKTLTSTWNRIDLRKWSRKKAVKMTYTTWLPIKSLFMGMTQSFQGTTRALWKNPPSTWWWLITTLLNILIILHPKDHSFPILTVWDKLRGRRCLD